MTEEKRDKRSWFLRIATGTVFGPVSTQGLIAWAEQGRVQAGNGVSNDRKEWVAAETVPELDITWYLEEPGGSLAGPFHQRAARKLLDEKRAPEGARLIPAAEADLSRLRTPAESREAGAGDGHLELALDSAPAEGQLPDNQALLEERESLRLQLAGQEEQMRSLMQRVEKEKRSQVRQLDAARKQVAELERELEELRQLPMEAPPEEDITKLKMHIAELVGQIAEDSANTERIEVLLQEREELDAALRAARSSYAELLAYSNERDQQHEESVANLQGEVNGLQQELAALREAAAEHTSPDHIREMHRRLQEQEILLAGVLKEESAAVEQVLALEREAFASWREESLARQKLLQQRLTTIQKLQGGETADVFEREAKARSEKAFTAKLQDSLDLLRSEHARYARQAESRERELVTRVRTLELEEEHLKERAAEAELLIQRNQQLSEQLHDREQKLAQERQQRSIEQAQLEEAHRALIEQMDAEKRRGDMLPFKEPLVEEELEHGGKLPPRTTFRVTPWMQLKR